MKRLIIILPLLIACSTASWAQEDAEERLNEVIGLQTHIKGLKTLRQGWSAYKTGDYEGAFELWMPLAEEGNSSAQVSIGLMYNQGNGVEEDENEAAKWYALASEQGYAPAKWRLAMLYYHGSGLEQNYKKAADLYLSAAKQGDVYSQKALGIMYSKGLGVPKDTVLAYSWLHVAHKNGFKLAQTFQDKIAVKMTPEETSIAQTMARECINSNYMSCGWALSRTDGSIKDGT